MDLDYHLIPEHCREGMQRYIEQGILPGDFLRAIICNDLVEAASRADIINRYRLYDYAGFLFQAPSGCWGSEEKMQAWHDRRGLSGAQRKES